MGKVFLILVPLLFIGMISSIIYIIVKGANTKKSLIAIAKEKKWKYYKNISEGNYLEKYLNNSLYKIHSNRDITIKNIIDGNYKDFDFSFAFYKAVNNKGTSNSSKISSTFNIFVVPQENIDTELMIIHRTKAMRFLPIEKLLQKIGHKLEVPKQIDLDWLLVSDNEKFEQLGFNSKQLQQLQETISAAHSILLYKGFFIYSFQWNTSFNAKKMQSLLPRVQQLNNLFKK